jgi:hypothetical protein
MRSVLGAVLLATTLSCSDEMFLDSPDGGAPPDAGRAPSAPRDLRFKGIGAHASYMSERVENAGYARGVGITITRDGSEFEFSALQLASNSSTIAGYDWRFFDFAPTAGGELKSSMVKAARAEMRDADLGALIAEQKVITSLDVRPDAYAAVAVGLADREPRYTSSGIVDLARAELDGWVATEAAAGRVVTALSSSSDRIHVVSYARSDDTSTYEAQVLDASVSTLLSQATALASGGYFITAFGVIGPDAFVFVGTRAIGSTAPRELFTPPLDIYPINALGMGYVLVCFVFDGADNHFISQR